MDLYATKTSESIPEVTRNRSRPVQDTYETARSFISVFSIYLFYLFVFLSSSSVSISLANKKQNEGYHRGCFLMWTRSTPSDALALS